MKLGEIRRVLSFFAMAFTAFATVLLIVATVLSATLARGRYIKERLVTDELVDSCISQLEIKYAELEAESNIPIRVFETMADDFTVSNSLKANVEECYNDDIEVKDERSNLINSFEGLCKEYLDGNKIKYNPKSVRNTAEKATDIYIETTYIKGLDGALKKGIMLKRELSSASLVAVVALSVGLLILLILYSNRKGAFFNFFSAVSSGALAGIIAGLATVIAKPVMKLGITPAIYGGILNNLMLRVCLLIILASVVIFVASYGIVLIITKKLIDAEK